MAPVSAGALTMAPSAATGTGTATGAAAATMAPMFAGADLATMAPPTPGVPTPRPGTGATSSGADGPLTPGQAFGSRYHIIRLLGAGGMGAVYQAWDAELGVAVAIKVIRPEIVADPRAAADVERRFKRELLLARQVTHKHVVRIHDLGEIDGIKYITMEYVDGTDLASVLQREGAMPVASILPIARSIVSGLTAAHAAGVVHRDLKPANIIISAEGEALIMDFGIARSAGGPSGAPAAAGLSPVPVANVPRAMTRVVDATLLGVIVGTIEYMAPEQAKGQAVDQRADIYAVGLILYDALVGRRRSETAGSAIAELQTRMLQAPPRVKSLLPTIPDPVDALIARCLEPDAAKRFQTTVELAAELEQIDENGEAVKVRRVVGMPLLAATIALAASLAGGAWWYAGTLAPPVAHDPVSVVIADIDNQTGDPAFDGTLEPMLKRALEGAGFISAYDRNAMTRLLGVRPPDTLNEVTARQYAVKQGLGVVLSGAILQAGSGFDLTITATQPVTGDTIATARTRASGRDQVLSAATQLATRVRRQLGDDEESESAQIFAMASVSATSLDVVRHYAAAQEAASNNRFDEARAAALQAVALDPKFGIGYVVAAVAARNLGRVQEARQHIGEALKYLDGMTDREKLNTRGMSYRVSGDYKLCVQEFGQLIERYAADVVGHNQLALCLSQLREMGRAVEEMQKVVALLPNRTTFRDNLALYANYAGDFATAEREALTVREQAAKDAYAALALAFAQLGQGQIPQAKATYEQLATFNALGASFAASGLGDLAVLEGRYADAVRILGEGAAADLKDGNPDRAAAKLTALANAQQQRGQKAAALLAVEQALGHSNAVKIRFMAGRVFVEAGEATRARPLLSGLASELQTEPQVYAKILEGELALKSGNAREAIRVVLEANELLETWVGNFVLGRAYLAAGALPQADTYFDSTLKKKGEALSLFLDEEPTFGVFPPVHYYQGLVREGMKNAGFAESFREYLKLRGGSSDDALVRDARRRAGG